MKPTRHALLARFIAEQAVRNSMLESYHAGITPSSEVGDYSDVSVVTPYGKIPWNKVGRLSDPEMRALMLQIERGIAQCLRVLSDLSKTDRRHFYRLLERQYFGPHGVSWDRPNQRTEPSDPGEIQT